jgi:hypothetical protein
LINQLINGDPELQLPAGADVIRYWN